MSIQPNVDVLKIEADEDDLPDEGFAFDPDKAEVSMGEDELAARLWAGLKADMPRKSAEAEAALMREARKNGTKVHGFIDGLGQNLAGIPREVYAYWIARLGPRAWDDGDLLRYLAKKNPALLRKSRGKTMVVVAWKPQHSTAPARAAA